MDSLAEGAAVAEGVMSSWLFFDPESDEARGTKVKAKTSAKSRREKRLFCVACRAWITHQDECIPVQGAHEHDCTNPHGLSFRIGCFRSARGCSRHGAATLEYSWFTGYAWRIALCAKCQTHLGWEFETNGDGFYGLILNRLTSRAGTQG